MKNAICWVLAIVAVGYAAIPSQPVPAQETRVNDELEGTLMFLLDGGSSSLRVVMKDAQVISVGNTDFLKGTVVAPKAGRSSFPPGTKLRVNMDRIAVFTEPLPPGESRPFPEK